MFNVSDTFLEIYDFTQSLESFGLTDAVALQTYYFSSSSSSGNSGTKTWSST